MLSIDDTGVTKSHLACLIIIELARIGFFTRGLKESEPAKTVSRLVRQ